MTRYIVCFYTKIIFLSSILCAFSLTGCFHYTPSRTEIAQAGDNSVAGPEAFAAYQSDLHTRLENLIKERESILKSRNTSAYLIGRGDILKLDVYGFSDVSGEMAVSEEGNMSVPLLGAIRAEGRTVSDLQNELTIQLARFIRNPKVRLSVNSFNAYQVSVVGAISKPGFYPIKHTGYLLNELLAEAGGPKDSAANRLYLIPANTQSNAEITPQAAKATDSSAKKIGVEINMEELVGTLDKPPILLPVIAGDTIVIPDAGQFRVDGEVERPGSFSVSPKTSTLSAIAAAGGFTYAANVNEVEVIRDIGAGKKASVTIDLEKVAFRGSPDIGLRDGDVVVVPSAPGRFRARQLVETFRSIFRGGVTGSIRYQ